MQVEDIIAELEQSGVVLAAIGDEVRLHAPAGRVPDPGVIAELRQQKAAVLAYLHAKDEAAGDPYAKRMQAALGKIALPDYPVGMILWLETAHPELYEELTSWIPDEIGRLWNERAPLEQFESVLVHLVSLHRRCCELYRATQSEAGTPRLR